MERKLAAILSADVQGYSRLMGEDEEATIRTLTAYREVMTRLIEQHRGRVVDSPGDNLLAEFASAVDAVQGAVAVQQALKTRNAELPENRQMLYRLGINVGDVVVEGERIYGDGVNIAARIESLADGGGISVSANVHEQVKNKLELTFTSQGEQVVKNIADPVRVYKVELEAEATAPSISGEPPGELPLPDKPSIAVLPFINMSNDPEQDYFSDGMTDDIITDLSKISGLFVIARNSTFTYKGQAVKIADVGRELGVRHVLEGSVRKAGNRVRINVQLIDAPTGGHMWAERYDRELDDIFALQDEITQKIVFALKVTLSPEEQTRFRQAPTTNLDAYDAYLRGIELFWRMTQRAGHQARQLFERAVELDGHYAAAYARLAQLHLFDWVWQWQQTDEPLAFAFTQAQQAVHLDERLPTAHLALAEVLMWQKQHEQAITEGERARRLDPNDADITAVLASILASSGRAAESLGLLETAMRLNPHYPPRYSFFLGHTHYVLGQLEEALGVLNSVVSRNPEYLTVRLNLAAIYSELGRSADARREAQAVLRINPHFSLTLFEPRLCFKDPADTARWIDELRRVGLK